MAMLIKSTGVEVQVVISHPSECWEFQEHIGGLMEIVRLKDGRFMVLDEEGKLKRKPYNKTASELAHGCIAADDYIVGDVLICNANEIE